MEKVAAGKIELKTFQPRWTKCWVMIPASPASASSMSGRLDAGHRAARLLHCHWPCAQHRHLPGPAGHGRRLHRHARRAQGFATQTSVPGILPQATCRTTSIARPSPAPARLHGRPGCPALSRPRQLICEARYNPWFCQKGCVFAMRPLAMKATGNRVTATLSGEVRLQACRGFDNHRPLQAAVICIRCPHGTRLRRNGQEAHGREQCFPRQQQNQAPVPAEPAIPPFLGREREPLGAPARFQRGPAPDRQERHRLRARRPARTWQKEKHHGKAKADATRSSWNHRVPVTSTPRPRTRRRCPKRC